MKAKNERKKGLISSLFCHKETSELFKKNCQCARKKTIKQISQKICYEQNSLKNCHCEMKAKKELRKDFPFFSPFLPSSKPVSGFASAT